MSGLPSLYSKIPSKKSSPGEVDDYHINRANLVLTASFPVPFGRTSLSVLLGYVWDEVDPWNKLVGSVFVRSMYRVYRIIRDSIFVS